MVAGIDIKTKFALPLCMALALIAAAFAMPSEPAMAAQQEEHPLLMIVVGFEGKTAKSAVPYSNTYDWGSTLFSGDDSLAAYYREQSQGSFSLVPAHESSEFGQGQNMNKADRPDDGVVHVTLNSTHRAWDLVNEDANVKSDFIGAALDAIDAASAFVDFKSFDKDGDGRLSSDELVVIICTSGYDASGLGQAAQGNLPLLWPHSGTIGDDATKGFDNVGALPEVYVAIAERYASDDENISDAIQEPIGIIAHEMGHSLGLVDLYPLEADDEAGYWADYKVENLSLMATGAWARALDDTLGWIFRPTALDPWSLTRLGWCTPETVKDSGEYHLFSRASDEGYNVLLIPTSDTSQYFLLENREPEGCDASFKNTYASSSTYGGIVIWHVDLDACEQYAKTNQINGTDHRPGVMPYFFEVDESGAYTLNLEQGTPDLTEPFFSTTSVERNLGSSSSVIELPLYGQSGEEDLPIQRTPSGIALQIISEPGQDMAVRVRLAGDTEAASSPDSWSPPVALIVVLVTLCAAGAAALAINAARRNPQREQ